MRKPRIGTLQGRRVPAGGDVDFDGAVEKVLGGVVGAVSRQLGGFHRRRSHWRVVWFQRTRSCGQAFMREYGAA
jgi:hypothetical protein